MLCISEILIFYSSFNSLATSHILYDKGGKMSQNKGGAKCYCLQPFVNGDIYISMMNITIRRTNDWSM